MELLKLNLFIFISLTIGNLIAGSWAYTSDPDCQVDLSAGICNKLCCGAAHLASFCFQNSGTGEVYVYCDCYGFVAPPKFYCTPSPGEHGGTCQDATTDQCYAHGEIIYDCVVPGLDGPICTCANPQ